MNSQGPNVFSSIGVDLIEFGKAKSFYKTHRGRLNSFFSGREISFIKRGKRPHERLAALMAAKEAVFKAHSMPWMGLEGFRKIRLFPGKSGRKSRAYKLSFTRSEHYVIARCYLNPCAGI